MTCLFLYSFSVLLLITYFGALLAFTPLKLSCLHYLVWCESTTTRLNYDKELNNADRSETVRATMSNGGSFVLSWRNLRKTCMGSEPNSVLAFIITRFL